MNKQIFARYKAIDGCLRNEFKRCGISELLDACNRALAPDGIVVSVRTVRDDLKNIQREPFYAPIVKRIEGHTAYYSYKDPSFTIFSKIYPDGAKSALREALDAMSLLDDDPYAIWCRSLFQQFLSGDADVTPIVVFQNNPDLEGIQHFTSLLSLVSQHQPIALEYQPFGKPLISGVFHPYLLKQFNDRWFLVGCYDGSQSISVCSIDRIKSVRPAQGVPFVPCNVDLDDFFADVVGVSVTDNAPVEDIVLKVSPRRYDYIRSKPIHFSQTELHDRSDDNHKFVRLRLKQNFELTQLLLSFGPDVEVVEPESLREKMRGLALSLQQTYSS